MGKVLIDRKNIEEAPRRKKQYKVLTKILQARKSIRCEAVKDVEIDVHS